MRAITPAIHNAPSRLVPWGTSLGLRITKAVAKVAGVEADSQVTISAQPGRIVIESVNARPTLEAMLARFDPVRHGGEAMAFTPVGKEVF
ncbi:MAG: hypothetical protein LH632_02600 [Rhodoferax sp.]|nr:hypothetical protein [Rhodoferax sp.]